MQRTVQLHYMIDRRLHMLQLLDRHGTVHAVATALHYTPSAVSQALRSLSAELGTEIVRPRGRGVRITPAGRTLLSHAEILFAQWERARAALDAYDEEPSGTLGICGFSTAAAVVLPRAAGALRERFPHLGIRITEAEPTECFDLLLSGEADIALVVATPDTPSPSDPRFDQRPLFDDALDLLIPQDHPLAGAGEVRLVDVAHEQWIVSKPGSTYHQLVLAACATAGFSPRIAHRSDEWETATALVAQGFGVCLVPQLAGLPSTHPVSRLRLTGDPAPARRVLTATRLGSRDRPVISSVLDAITAVVRRLDLRPLAGAADHPAAVSSNLPD
ncbi:LysR substrate-binding domain-containing protein [Actinoalloteichus spitiensis]|uniref:LysR substrate-binding domain-containing protein n=1 Tax=Actinoalloteichus spitiensis TaxID=252394 RepID=UPI000372D9B4|nr:LysR substrate-binding domain-containing protein [Actinoalloteichus spitiensis]